MHMVQVLSLTKERGYDPATSDLPPSRSGNGSRGAYADRGAREGVRGDPRSRDQESVSGRADPAQARPNHEWRRADTLLREAPVLEKSRAFAAGEVRRKGNLQ